MNTFKLIVFTIIFSTSLISCQTKSSKKSGADIIVGLASLNPSDKILNYLFIDIGTNREMAMVTPDKIF